jgi:hypothetical protein
LRRNLGRGAPLLFALWGLRKDFDALRKLHCCAQDLPAYAPMARRAFGACATAFFRRLRGRRKRETGTSARFRFCPVRLRAAGMRVRLPDGRPFLPPQRSFAFSSGGGAFFARRLFFRARPC